MTLRLLISLSLLLFSWRNAGAQLAPADDFFNSGAQFYISNNIPAALERVETGLKIYPDNAKLKKLEKLLKQQQQQQSQQNQSKQKQSQSQQQEQQQQQQQQQKQTGGQQNQQQQNQQQARQNQPQQKSEEQKQKQEQAAAANSQAMTPEEAKRLLDAQKGNEQFLQLKPQGKPEDQNRPFKDW